MEFFKCDRCKRDIEYMGNRTHLMITEHKDQSGQLIMETRGVDLCPECTIMFNNFLQKKILNYSDITGGNK